MKEIRERMEKRGLQNAMMIGYVTDEVASKEVGALFEKVSPGTKWVRTAHDRFRDNIMGLSLGYTSEPYVWARRLFCEDPSVSRSHGWRLNVLEAHFPRNLYDNFPLTQWRYMAEMNAAGELRGFARLGGDFFSVLKRQRAESGHLFGAVSAVVVEDAEHPDVPSGGGEERCRGDGAVRGAAGKDCRNARRGSSSTRRWWTRRRRRSWGRSGAEVPGTCWTDALAI